MRCHAEIKVRNSKPWLWRTCTRQAKWSIQASSGAYLQYCEHHKNHATDSTCMTPATVAKLEPIIR